MKSARSLTAAIAAVVLLTWMVLDRRSRPAGAAPVVPAAQPDRLAADMASAARDFLEGLVPELRAKAHLGYDHPMRLVWHYYPTVAWQRTGVMLKDLDAEGKRRFLGLIRTGTSEAGFRTTQGLMQLEAVLREIENTEFARQFRDPERFYLTIFGTPAMTGRWSWKLEGHHLLLHYVIEEGRVVAVTPFVLGANPARVPSGPERGARLLAEHEDLARRLYTSLLPEARRQATVAGEPPFDLVTNVDTPAKRLAAQGLAQSQMRPAERDLLRRLLGVHAGLLAEPAAARLLADVAGDEVWFAWAGSALPGKPHYYRLQGQRFLVEFCNTQNDGNHVHVVWRGYVNDFGEARP